MTWIDIRDSITKLISSKLKIKVYSENIDKVEKPCFFINLIDYKKEFDSQNRELKTIQIDIDYRSKTLSKNANAEIFTALENLDNAFDREGRKILKVEDRFLSLKNVDMAIVDSVGHYVFTISLYDLYGELADYEPMGEISFDYRR